MFFLLKEGGEATDEHFFKSKCKVFPHPDRRSGSTTQLNKAQLNFFTAVPNCMTPVCGLMLAIRTAAKYFPLISVITTFDKPQLISLSIQGRMHYVVRRKGLSLTRLNFRLF